MAPGLFKTCFVLYFVPTWAKTMQMGTRKVSEAPNWEKLWGSPPLEGPDGRQAHSIVDWSEGESLVVFGGVDADTNVLGELWLYNYSETNQNENRWELSEGGNNRTGAEPVFGHTATIWPSTQKMVVFGGAWRQQSNGAFTTAGGHLVRVLDLQTMSWTTLEPDGASVPRARVDHEAVIYNDSLYVYGGIDIDQSELLGDLWRYDLDQGTWELLYEPEPMLSNVSPGPSARAGMAACLLDTRLVMYGGQDEWQTLSDIWAYDLAGEEGWAEGGLDDPWSYPRSYHSLVCHGGYLWSFGGLERVYSGGNQYYLFAYSSLHAHIGLNGGPWLQHAEAETSVSPRYDHAACVSQHGLLYVYGGRLQVVSDSNDLLVLDVQQLEPHLEKAPPDPSHAAGTELGGSLTLVNLAVLAALVCSCCCFGLSYWHLRRRAALQLRLNEGQLLAALGGGGGGLGGSGAGRRGLTRAQIAKLPPPEVYRPGARGAPTGGGARGGAWPAPWLAPTGGAAAAAAEGGGEPQGEPGGRGAPLFGQTDCPICLGEFGEEPDAGPPSPSPCDSEAGRSSPSRSDVSKTQVVPVVEDGAVQQVAAGESTVLVRRLPCQHYFHPSCIEEWLLTQANCPLCKQEVFAPGEAGTARDGQRESQQGLLEEGEPVRPSAASSSVNTEEENLEGGQLLTRTSRVTSSGVGRPI